DQGEPPKVRPPDEPSKESRVAAAEAALVDALVALHGELRGSLERMEALQRHWGDPLDERSALRRALRAELLAGLPAVGPDGTHVRGGAARRRWRSEHTSPEADRRRALSEAPIPDRTVPHRLPRGDTITSCTSIASRTETVTSDATSSAAVKSFPTGGSSVQVQRSRTSKTLSAWMSPAEIPEPPRALSDASGPLGRSRLLLWMLVHVHVKVFDAAIGLLIVANSICAGVETQCDLDGSAQCSKITHVLEHIFLVAFLLELIIRAVADGRSILQSPWFRFDAILVLIGVLSFWVVEPIIRTVMANGTTEVFGIISLVLVLRLLRLIRLVRALRLFQQFQEMWKIASGFMAALRTALSACVLIVLTVYVFACLGSGLITRNSSLHEDPATAELIQSHFPSLQAPKGNVVITKVDRSKGDAITRGTFQERKQANALARLHRLKWLEEHGRGRGEEARALRAKLDRALPHKDFDQMGSLSALARQQAVARLMADAEVRLRTLTEERREKRLEDWRSRVQSTQRKAHEWLKDFTPKDVMVKEGETTAQDTNEALGMLRRRWRKVWDREKPPAHRRREKLGQWLPMLPEQQWPKLSEQDVREGLRRQAGSSAGPDGWTGDELVDAMFASEAITNLLNEMEQAACVPDGWKQHRQAHLPKAVPEGGSNALSAEDYRPICAASAWYRLWATSRVRSEASRRWQDTWWDTDMVGAKKGFESHQATASSIVAANMDMYVTSWDYSLVFDMADPAIAGHALSELGLPSNIGNMLMSTWGDQRRWLQLAGCTLQEPQRVSSSLPHGDPWSPMALFAMLLAPLKQIKHNCEDIHVQLHIDDRTWESPSIITMLRAADYWTKWSETLGLKENEKKKQWLHRRPRQRRQLAEAGIDPASIHDAIDVLGVKITLGRSRKLSKKETRFRAQQDTIMALARVVSKRAHTLSDFAWVLPWTQKGSFAAEVSSHLKLTGWRPTAARWTWQHSGLENTPITLDHTSREWRPPRALGHVLREAWRHAQYDSFIKSKRRDAAIIRQSGIGYNPVRVKAVAQCYDENPGKAMRVLAGAVVSPMCIAIARRDPGLGECPWRGAPHGTLDHIAWECANVPGRPPVRPADVLQRRLFWPKGTKAARAVGETIFRWACTLDDLLLQERPLSMTTWYILTLARFANADSMSAVYTPMVERAWYLMFYFGLVWLIVTAAAGNLVIGVIVDTARVQGEYDQDFELAVQRKRNILESDQLVAVCEYLDPDGSGVIDETEFIDGIFTLVLQSVPIETTQILQMLRSQSGVLQSIERA
ncbi:unnamed protein product, partial [Prorocentrum cordatum]